MQSSDAAPALSDNIPPGFPVMPCPVCNVDRYPGAPPAYNLWPTDGSSYGCEIGHYVGVEEFQRLLDQQRRPSAAALVEEWQKAEVDVTIATLRDACRRFGDNDWPDDLHLTDIIEKHLLRHLAEPGLTDDQKNKIKALKHTGWSLADVAGLLKHAPTTGPTPAPATNFYTRERGAQDAADHRTPARGESGPLHLLCG